MNLNVMEDASEIVHYENPNIPIYVKYSRLSTFSHMRALGHWHEDIEIMKAVKGKFAYEINGRKFLVQEGDAILVNSRQMHYGYSPDGRDCEFLCILFKPDLLAANAELQAKYVDTITRHPYITGSYLSRENPQEASMLRILDEFFPLPGNTYAGYELEVLSKLYLLWLGWFRLLQPQLLEKVHPSDGNLPAQKRMVEYIYKNYARKLVLGEIAQAGGVCRSKCCEIFKKYLGKTPIEFLNDYRLQVAMNLLAEASHSITEIALACGFASPSYFAEMFLKVKGCTPRSYRRQQKFSLKNRYDCYDKTVDFESYKN